MPGDRFGVRNTVEAIRGGDRSRRQIRESGNRTAGTDRLESRSVSNRSVGVRSGARGEETLPVPTVSPDSPVSINRETATVDTRGRPTIDREEHHVCSGAVVRFDPRYFLTASDTVSVVSESNTA